MVSVARRNLFQEKTTLIISTGGVAFALLLILALDGLVAGSTDRLTAYIKNSGVQLYAAQSGVRTMHMSASAIPLDRLEEIRRVEGIARVAPILYAFYPVTAGDARSMAYVVGFDPAQALGGPWSLSSGSADLGAGEAVLDATAAGRLGVGIGDEVQLLGGSFRIRGISEETSNIANTIAFVRFEDFARLRAQSGTASYLLVELREGARPEDVAGRVRTAVDGLEVMTQAEFAGSEAAVVRDMSAEIMLIMNAIGFLIGLAAVALTIYTATIAKVGEFGVLKAIGAADGWLCRLVIEQAFWSVGSGAVVALALAAVLAAGFNRLLPDTPIILVGATVAKTILAALAISLLSAVVPVRQISRLDPAVVFRR